MANLDNYLPCESYQNATENETYPGFKTWMDQASGLWYFGVATNTGRIVLRSEGYTSDSGRNNGIESVMRNRDIEERYVTVQDESDGKWYIALRAGNRQEIARSCPYDSESAAQAGIATCFSTYVEPVAAAATKAASTKIDDDYLDCAAYTNQPDSSHAGFSAFTTEDGQHYFTMLNKDGSVAMRSEGYTTPSARDNGIESVMRNRDLEERYSTVKDENDGHWYVVLKAGNRQEIARSCGYESEAAAAGWIKSWFAPPAVVETEKRHTVIEDYLPCEAYANHSASEKHSEFTIFTIPDSGLHYFALVDKNGKVVLKSEGYTTTAARDNGIESVLKNREIKERWVQSKDDGGHYYSLRAGNRLEIARTCHYESESALLGWWTPFMAPIATVAAIIPPAPNPVKVQIVEETAKKEEIVVPKPEPVKEEIKVEKVIVPPVIVETPKVVAPPAEEYVPQWKKKEEKTVVYTKPIEEPVVVPPVAMDAAAGGGSSWWKWLLPLLLLLGLFLLWRNCGGCKQTPPPPPPPPVDKPAVVPVDTPKAVTPPPATTKVSCNCNVSTDPLFNLSNLSNPKSLTRLGTNPEFGSLHGLNPQQFMDKLQSRYKSNSVDKAFLDRIYKGMGYTGFADAKVEQITEVEVPVGTVGNMGYSKMHKTAYDRLDASGKDLLAFRIKAANGCDLHFMRTCGNHFFFCPN